MRKIMIENHSGCADCDALYYVVKNLGLLQAQRFKEGIMVTSSKDTNVHALKYKTFDKFIIE